MKTIRNTTLRSLSVPLPRGKKLFLGPLKVGEIATPAAEHPPLKAMVEVGDLEILGEGERPLGGRGGRASGSGSSQGHRQGLKSGRGGDR